MRETERSLKTKDTAHKLRLWGATIPFSPTSFFTGTHLLNSKAAGSLSQANPLNLSPKPLFL